MLRQIRRRPSSVWYVTATRVLGSKASALRQPLPCGVGSIYLVVDGSRFPTQRRRRWHNSRGWASRDAHRDAPSGVSLARGSGLNAVYRVTFVATMFLLGLYCMQKWGCK